jgi:hypothetical protein
MKKYEAAYEAAFNAKDTETMLLWEDKMYELEALLFDG